MYFFEFSLIGYGVELVLDLSGLHNPKSDGMMLLLRSLLASSRLVEAERCFDKHYTSSLAVRFLKRARSGLYIVMYGITFWVVSVILTVVDFTVNNCGVPQTAL